MALWREPWNVVILSCCDREALIVTSCAEHIFLFSGGLIGAERYHITLGCDGSHGFIRLDPRAIAVAGCTEGSYATRNRKAKRHRSEVYVRTVSGSERIRQDIIITRSIEPAAYRAFVSNNGCQQPNPIRQNHRNNVSLREQLRMQEDHESSARGRIRACYEETVDCGVYVCSPDRPQSASGKR
jgi:hypothetical protein